MINYDRFRLSLKRLEEQQAHLQSLDPALPYFIREAVPESVIRRFNVCYDCLCRVLRRHLIEELGLPNPPDNPKPLIRVANRHGLLAFPVERWLEYANARKFSYQEAHDFEEVNTRLELIPDFIDDAIDLYQTITGLKWA